MWLATQEEVRELLEDVHSDRVFSVEEDVVWISGMNASCGFVARQIAKTLVKHGIPAGLVHEDGVHAVNNGGLQFRYGENA